MGPGAKPLSSVGPQGAAAGRGDLARPGGDPPFRAERPLAGVRPNQGAVRSLLPKLFEKTSLSFIDATSESRPGLGGEGGPLGGWLCLCLSQRQVLWRDSCPLGCHQVAGKEALPQQSRGWKSQGQPRQGWMGRGMNEEQVC